MHAFQPLNLFWAVGIVALVGLFYATAAPVSEDLLSQPQPSLAELRVADASVLVQRLQHLQEVDAASASSSRDPEDGTELDESQEESLDDSTGLQRLPTGSEDIEQGEELMEEAAEDRGEKGAHEEDSEEDAEEAEGEDEGGQGSGEEGGDEEDEAADEEGGDAGDAEDGEDDRSGEDDAEAEEQGGVEGGQGAGKEEDDDKGASGGAQPQKKHQGSSNAKKKRRKEQERAQKLLDSLEEAKASSKQLQDLQEVGADARAGLDDSGEANGVLLFFAVGSSNRTMDLLIENVKRVRRRLRGTRADVFLAHYDSNKARWLELHESWYRENVQFSAQRPGYKFKLAQATLPTLLAKQEPYEWIWLLDEDADFTNTDLWTMLRDAEVTRSLIVAPSVIDMRLGANGTAVLRATRPAAKKVVASLLQTQTSCKPGSLMCQHQAPHKYCQYRYVTFLEVMFPLLRQEPLLKLLSDECEHCLHERSVWGLDKIWCGFTARMFNTSKRRTCAILDRVHVVHTDHRTMEKWDENGGVKTSVKKVYSEEEADTMLYHQQDNGFTAESTCVLPPKKVKFHSADKAHKRQCLGTRLWEAGSRRRRRRGCSRRRRSLSARAAAKLQAEKMAKRAAREEKNREHLVEKARALKKVRKEKYTFG